MKRILFQGDSITDCGRSREVLTDVGNGYPYLVRAHYGLEKPGQFEIVNRGISGNRITDVYARIKRDIINLKPDYMSLLIGVNDVWHEFSRNDGVDADKFEKIYCMLIEEVKAALPDIKIMILAPFCLRASATENTEECPNKWEGFRTGVEERARRAKAVAEKYNLPFITLQDKFDAAAETAENTYWLYDGVHPTPMGHQIIKNEWIKGFRDLIK
jgi:lysophospholipase L1-like esterase